ncbi:uncharacterized protein LOC133514348 isoform X1 [Syngnathoides biaculeatus]|uniref:uncharacterized protein LOC133514348 isoform X1 n=1 Tax=Syngnathoides biaculeatus TaxID=300417 RepID=UPI002ADE930A|nr:uncharacterized protein LOC133514348 isoform X1 [Syngnathoides biaculeatus]
MLCSLSKWARCPTPTNINKFVQLGSPSNLLPQTLRASRWRLLSPDFTRTTSKVIKDSCGACKRYKPANKQRYWTLNSSFITGLWSPWTPPATKRGAAPVPAGTPKDRGPRKPKSRRTNCLKPAYQIILFAAG